MEFVYVVPRHILFPKMAFQGLYSPEKDGPKFLQLISSAGFFAERPVMENNHNYKQIIPYVVVTQPIIEGEQKGQMRVLAYLRPDREDELSGKWAFGFGGHINPEDVEGNEEGVTEIHAGLVREVREELGIDPEFYDPLFHGFINDDSHPIGSVHLGVQMSIRLKAGFELDFEEILKSNEEIKSLEWHVAPEGENPVAQDPDMWEGWSQLLAMRYWRAGEERVG